MLTVLLKLHPHPIQNLCMQCNFYITVTKDSLFERHAYCFFQEGIKIKSSSGFHGKGFKFDETEAQLSAERKKLQKAALGLVDSDEEDPNEDVSFSK